MIGKLYGIVSEIFSDSITLYVSGVGYDILLPKRVIKNMNLGDYIQLFIHTHVREDQITLYGFDSFEDKRWFLEIGKVSGIGSKTVLNILNVVTSEEILQAILLEDKKIFQQVSGIGEKVATRLINELKNTPKKIDTFRISLDMNQLVKNSADININEPKEDQEISHNKQEENYVKYSQNVEQVPNLKSMIIDAVSALENLGYERGAALRAFQELHTDASEEEKQNIKVEDLVKIGLKYFSNI